MEFSEIDDWFILTQSKIHRLMVSVLGGFWLFCILIGSLGVVGLLFVRPESFGAFITYIIMAGIFILGGVDAIFFS